MVKLDQVIDELVDMVLMQYEEISKLNDKIRRMKQHIETYEEMYEEFKRGEK